MKFLITGANGQLGRSLQRVLGTHELFSHGHAELDITDPACIAEWFVQEKPQAVIHCAALTDTKLCEKESALARQVNGIGTENIARACARSGARLVAISTNEVFDGAQSTPYYEYVTPRPLNAYAVSKLDGETLAGAVHRDTLIVRTSWLYGDGYVNFNEKVLAAATEARPLSFVTDEVAAPTSTDDLAAAIAALLEREASPGVYHLSNAGVASRYDWAVEVLRLAGIDASVTPVTTAELRANGYAGPQKPPYSVLANARALAMGVTMRDWREALSDYFGRRAERSAATADA
jgi:dTDP-4-dehydrorhamnose reductase